VVVYGDTNSSLAGALCAARLGVPVAHVEAGLRSFDRNQPEEQNRVVIDHLSARCFAPTSTAVSQLAAEGIRAGVHRVGDVMLDALRAFAGRALPPPGLEPRSFYYVTIHRAETVDRPETLAVLLEAIGDLDRPAVFAVHPRTRARLAEHALAVPASLRVREPAGYLESLGLVRDARAVLTDSGGLLREAYFLGTPCVILRDRTEWPETLERGRNRLGGTRRDTVRAALAALPAPEPPPESTPLGDGHAAERIAEILQ
jgi:UDP-N-acetylglucosamine 2-epimerase